MRWFELNFVSRRPWMWRALTSSYAQVAAGRPRLRSVEFGLTYGCPMDCPYCSAAGLMKERAEALTLAEWERVIGECVSLGAIHFLLTGGEPLQATQLLPLVRAIHQRRRVVSVVTTGWPLDEPLVRALAAAGLDAAEISLDGASSHAHDPYRGRPGAFDAALRAAALFQLHGITVLFTHVATKTSLRSGEVHRVVELARELGCRLNMGFPAMAGAFGDSWLELLNESEWSQLESLVDDDHVRSCAQSSYKGDGCTAGSEKIYITRYGDLTPCPLMPALRFGNIRDASVADLWARARRIPELSTGQPRCLPASDRAFVSRYLVDSDPAQ